MYTSILWFAVSGYLAPVGIVAPSPRMLRDYGSALERVQDERKPLAVFIGTGPTGWPRRSPATKKGFEPDTDSTSSPRAAARQEEVIDYIYNRIFLAIDARPNSQKVPICRWTTAHHSSDSLHFR